MYVIILLRTILNVSAFKNVCQEYLQTYFVVKYK